MNTIERNLTLGKLGFHACTQEELVRLIEYTPVEEGGMYVSFLGAPHVALAEKDPIAAKAYANATIVAMDGQPVATTARQCGIVSERCGGPDIMERILARSVAQGKTHYFYGESPEVLELLQENCKKRFPGIRIVGAYAPPYRDLTDAEEAEIVARIREADPDYLWVSLGSPKQDCWMERHAPLFPHSKLMGVGAAFKFLSGAIKRAPKSWQKHGLEWLYRILKEPHLIWQRYLRFAFGFYRIKRRTVKEYKRRQKAFEERISTETTGQSLLTQ